MNGCGWCNGQCVAGTATGSSDGRCTGSTWAWSMDQCANTACTACSATGTCPSGFECASRSCDARRACYVAGDPNANCATVGGVTCPATATYNRCTGSAECGDLATCTIAPSAPSPSTLVNGGYGWSTQRCSRYLGCQGAATNPYGCPYYGDNPCPAAPSDYPGVTAACAQVADSLRGSCFGCVLNCTPGAACPYGLHCANGRCVD